MSSKPSLQAGAGLSVIDRPKSSLSMSSRRGGPAGSQSQQRADVYHVIQAQLASSASFRSLVGAVDDFNESVTQGRRDLLIDKQTNFKVLHQTAQEDLNKRFSPNTPKSKRTQVWQHIKSGLEKFCQVVYSYSSVMDVLSSSHPEIASLAWGAMKFLLAISVNHQELREKIVHHMAEIGEHFKIVDSYVRLFPEMDMVEHVCGVYDNFTTFLQVSIKWCKENALVKFFKTVALLYEARIKPTIDELNAHLKRIKERVDVHNTHRIAVMHYDISALMEILDDSRRLQIDSHAVIAQYLQGIASDQRQQARQSLELPSGRGYLQLESGMADAGNLPQKELTVSLKHFADPQLTPERLKDHAIQSKRLEAKQSYFALDLPNKPEVKAWTASDSSSLLWIDGFANIQATKWTTEFSVDVLLGIERQSNTVLFYFGDVAMNDVADPPSGYSASSKAIVHSFIIQLLSQHPYLAGIHAQWLTPQRWIEARRSTKAAWTILHYLLNSLAAEARIVYIVIDSIDSLSTVNNHSCDLQPLLRRLSGLVTSPPPRNNEAPNSPPLSIKILLTSVTSDVHQLLFPPDTADSPPSHSIIHIPQTFGQHNVPPTPVHLRKPSVKRLVRLPDSDDEFGLKPADSFGFSDDELDESLIFSSDEEPVGTNLRSIGHREEKDYEAVGVKDKGARRQSESSEDWDFSDAEVKNASKMRKCADDIQFSSSSEEEDKA